jgi:hypothetical protein
MCILIGLAAHAQIPYTSSASNDLFVMFGCDFDRPGLLQRANYNTGLRHTFGFLKKDPFGDDVAGGHCSLERSQLNLDPRELQQSSHRALIHNHKHRLHLEMVKNSA